MAKATQTAATAQAGKPSPDIEALRAARDAAELRKANAAKALSAAARELAAARKAHQAAQLALVEAREGGAA